MIKPCPFCGNDPTLRTDPPCGGSGDVWAWIRCNKCAVMPSVGESRATFYYRDEALYTPVRSRSDEEATALAKEAVVRVWNIRR